MTDPGPVLIIPVYNPAPGWQEVLTDRFRQFLSATQMPFTLVLVNDGSTVPVDTQLISGELKDRFRYLSYDHNRGKGAAIKFGLSHYTSDINVFTDIDLPYTIESMAATVSELQKNSGISVGYRDEKYYADVSVFRTLLSKSLRWLNTIILGLPVNDTQCGLKAFDREVAGVICGCTTERFLIDLELLLAVSKRNIRITPVHVSLRKDVDFSKFNSSVLLKEVFSFLTLVWKYRIR